MNQYKEIRSYTVERKINDLQGLIKKINCSKFFIFNKDVFDNVSTA